MAVLGRLLIGSAERLDLPDLLSIESFASADFKYLIQSFVGGDTPYILKGFDIIQPQDSLGTESISVRVADSVVYHPSALAGSFFFGLPEGNENSEPLIPELRKNATNFIYLTFNTADTATDSRAFWDPDQNGGEGGEFSQDINTESILIVDVGVSVSTFPENTIPIAKVTVGASVIESIQDCRYMMFRLGSGGNNPDPFSTFNFRNDPSSAFARSEPSTLMTSSFNANPFQGGDKNIFTLKEWMDVVMTRFKEISGDPFWYSSGTASGFSVTDTFLDALGSSLRSKGQFEHDELVGGRVSWSEDISYHSLIDPREIIIRASTIDIASDKQVAYINMVRDESLNTTSTAVTWLNGVNYVDGPTGSFENLSKGDWVKNKLDTKTHYLRVEEFYASPGPPPPPSGGGTTTAALARSIKLSAAYTGTSGTEEGTYTKGEFDVTDIEIRDRDDQEVHDAGGDLFWLAYRSDTALSLASITPTQLSIDITDADGVTARCTSAGHGLQDKDRITITTGSYAGTYQVEVENVNEFLINTAVTGDESGQTAFYAVVETAARSTDHSYALESATHGMETDQRVFISGTSSLYDGDYLISKRSSTEFQIPIGSLIPDPGAIDGEIVRSIRVNVRTQFGTVKVIQGQSIDIGNPETENILSFVGMDSLAQTTPVYALPLGYNVLDGYHNYNSDASDNLTERVSKLTAMMADRVQERGFSIRGRVNIVNETNGANQDISASGTVTLHKPGSPEQDIDLTVSLPANSVAVANIDRDGNSAISLSVESIGSPFLIEENKIIVFYRFGDTNVYTWDDSVISEYGHLNLGLPEDSQNRNIFLFNPGQVRFNSGTGLLTFSISENNQQTTVIVLDGISVVQSSYFLINSAKDVTEYYVWYDVDGGGTDPAVAGKTGIQVSISSGDTAIQVADATVLAINTVASADFTADNDGGTSTTVTIDNDDPGLAQGASDFNTTFIISTPEFGLDPDPEIIISGANNVNTIDADTINTLGTMILPQNYAAWVRVNRFNAKTFNNIQTSDSVDTDANGSIYITSIEDVPTDQDVFVLWIRRGDNLVETHKALPPDDNVYEEFLEVVASVAANDNEIQGPVVPGTVINLPSDSRDGDSLQKYVVGAGHLQLELNGQGLYLDEDFSEFGSQSSESSRFIILQTLEVGDTIKIRIDSKGSVYFASTGLAGGTLQAAYNAGRFITVGAGQPVVIDGPASNKLLTVLGDVDITGVIDPTGLQFTPVVANPLAGPGLWVNDSNQLIYEGAGIVMDDLTIGSTSLTEANLTNLLGLQDGTDFAGGTNSHTHDGRYYTETELDGGVLDSRYYTETELDGGVLDSRYYTETELDSGALDGRYYTEAELDGGTLDSRYYTETELSPVAPVGSNVLDARYRTENELIATVSGPGSKLIGDLSTLYSEINQVSDSAEKTRVTINNNGSFYDVSGNGLHFLINSANDATEYYVWYNVTDGANTQTDPAVGGRTGIQVDILDADTPTDIATKTASAITTAAAADFSVFSSGSAVEITNTATGPTDDVADVNADVDTLVITQGVTLTGTDTVFNRLIAVDQTFKKLKNLYIEKTNNTGSVIPAGSVVILSQSVAGEIQLADATSISTSEGVVGVTVDNINDGESGRVQISGTTKIRGTITLGKRVYLSASTPGEVTSTAPDTAGNVVFMVGLADDTDTVQLNMGLIYIVEN